MPHKTEPVESSCYVRLDLTGDLTRTDHEVARAAAANVLKQKGWNKLFIDATQARPKMSVADDYEFTEQHDNHFPTVLRTAIVHGPDAAADFRFIENVGRNRGMNMRLFEDHAAALEWLLADAPS